LKREHKEECAELARGKSFVGLYNAHSSGKFSRRLSKTIRRNIDVDRFNSNKGEKIAATRRQRRRSESRYILDGGLDQPESLWRTLAAGGADTSHSIPKSLTILRKAEGRARRKQEDMDAETAKNMEITFRFKGRHREMQKYVPGIKTLHRTLQRRHSRRRLHVRRHSMAMDADVLRRRLLMEIRANEAKMEGEGDDMIMGFQGLLLSGDAICNDRRKKMRLKPPLPKQKTKCRNDWLDLDEFSGAVPGDEKDLLLKFKKVRGFKPFAPRESL